MNEKRKEGRKAGGILLQLVGQLERQLLSNR